jgi:lysozyme
MTDLVETLLGEEEGRETCVYKDSLGYWTIGIGCLVDPKKPGAGLCDEAISVQFSHDSAKAKERAARFKGFERCNDVQQAVLVSMCFQMGAAPLKWPNFCRALELGDYAAAAAHGLDSDWARDQTPKRAKRQMQMLSSGLWIRKE